LTGKFPFFPESNDAKGWSRAILDCDPKPPRQWDDKIPQALEQICLHCLFRLTLQRYSTAADLADELKGWLSATGRTLTEDRVEPKGLRAFGVDDASFFLKLLPGPRRDGMPESIRFWKTRIENLDGDPMFAVGLIHGPSGAGKSSFVKAGLLPQLNKRLARPIVVEATRAETEVNLKKRLHQLVMRLSSETEEDLAATIMAFCKTPPDREPRKILLVVDQFEQWLDGRNIVLALELVRALRQCDGRRVQALLVVRDEYLGAAIRLFATVEEPFEAGRNVASVELFDAAHARLVLADFGRALDRIPSGEQPSNSPSERFLSNAVEGLADDDGRINPLLLNVFVEVVRHREWTPETLSKLGGMGQIGVMFLEESFNSSSATADAKLHRAATEKVLRLLLPANIRGSPRSRQELRRASGYASSPDEFKAVLKLLDDLHLITPVEQDMVPEGGSTDEDERSYYQLTHDGLVSSLRMWFDNHDSATPQGKARVLLKNRTSFWKERRENRHLPTIWEQLAIRQHTRSSDWTDPEKQMMKLAFRVLMWRALAAIIVMGVIAAMYTYAQGSQLIQQLLRADSAKVPEVVQELRRYGYLVAPELKRLVAASAPGSRTDLHGRVALLSVDESQVWPLYDLLLDAAPSEAFVVRDALQPYAAKLTPSLWKSLESASNQTGQARLLTTASALAAYDSTNSRWAGVADKVGRALVAANPLLLRDWVDALRPVKNQLILPLSTIFHDKASPDEDRAIAANLLADYAKDQPKVLSELLVDADPKMFAVLFPVVQSQASYAIPFLETELSRPIELNSAEVAKDLVAGHQARAAVALMRLGQPARIWPLLRHSADPRLRNFLVNWLSPLGADPRILFAKLSGYDTRTNSARGMDGILFDPETSTRRALILAIGQNGNESLSASERTNIVKHLLALHANDPDAGIHGAAEWALKQLGAETMLQTNLQSLAKGERPNGRRWYVNKQGQTFAIVDGPVEFSMGSPIDEPDRDAEEIPHSKRIGSKFAICAKEVSRGEYQKFLDANPLVAPPTSNRFSAEAVGPVNNITWYEAAAYCNWLSREEGMASNQWCYLPNDRGEFSEGMRIPADVMQRGGYRLPLESEWEYACRAGAITARHYGVSRELLSQYAWFLGNSDDHARECGRLKPNDLGLFDMLGNVWEWCQERHLVYTLTLDASPRVEADGEAEEVVHSGYPRLLRGESFTDHPAYIRAARRDDNQPEDRGIRNGFRVARTLPAHETAP